MNSCPRSGPCSIRKEAILCKNCGTFLDFWRPGLTPLPLKKLCTLPVRSLALPLCIDDVASKTQFINSTDQSIAWGDLLSHVVHQHVPYQVMSLGFSTNGFEGSHEEFCCKFLDFCYLGDKHFMDAPMLETVTKLKKIFVCDCELFVFKSRSS